jgi:putative nucleotidyltransferase with HDIG domain
MRDTGSQGRAGMSPDVERLWESMRTRLPSTAEHSERVVVLADRLAEDMGLDEGLRGRLAVAARLHDLGECLLPRELSDQHAIAYTPEQRQLMNEHPDLGAEALERAGLGDDVVEAVRAHHERWDGGGYPRGLAGDEIPLPARILHVCEAWDAMRRHRVWAELITKDEALEELDHGAGNQFDPRVARSAASLFATADL